MISAETNQEADDWHDSSGPLLSAEEHSVLSLFRKYLMTPGKMLCISGSDLENFNIPLAQLSDKGLLVAESYRGGYSLTQAGFAAMQDTE
jgi:hypothetical protein